MTHRENFMSMLDGESPAWVPFTLDIGAMPGFTLPVTEMFRNRTGSSDPAEFFNYDTRICSVPAHYGGESPLLLHNEVPAGTRFDEWGIGHWAGGNEGTYEQMFPPLATADSPSAVACLPDPVIGPDISAAAHRVADFHRRGYPVFGYAGSIYEWSWWLRGMENFLADLLSDEDLAEAILDKVCAHTTRLAVATASIGVDVLCFYDDAGMQSGMQISPELWRKFVRPRWDRVLRTVRELHPGARFFFHSCGQINDIVPDLADLGFHLLHPIQPECMSFQKAYEDFGNRLVVCGTVSSQKTLPFGTPDDVRREVESRLAVASDRRTLLMPSNLLQPETSWENLCAFAEAASAPRSAFFCQRP